MGGWPEQAGQFQLETHYLERTVPCLTNRPRSLTEMLQGAVARHPENEALVCGRFRCSWQEFDDLVRAFASGLAGRGIGTGDRVILLLGNRAEFVIALFALVRLGAIAVPVGIREQAPGLAFIAEQSGATAILHEASLAELTPDLPLKLAIGDDDTRHFIAAFAGPSAAVPCDNPAEDDPALIMYTSGTTGKPKGAVVTHLALIHIGAAYAACMALGAQDRSVCVVPLSHITGITATVCAMTWTGGTIIVVPKFKANDFVALAVQEGMTHALLVPAMYNLLLARVDLGHYDLSAWRIGAFGGAPMPVSTIEGIAAQLPHLALMNCYGATETSGGVAIMPADHLLAKSDSVGWPIPGATIRVVDDHGRDVLPGGVGELWIGGATITPGYWENPEATAVNLVQGYWRSGDLGSIDIDGFVRVHDRLKDMINRGGYKIFTAEVESILTAHPDVLEAAVIAKPCPILGERVHAVITLREDASSLTADQLASYCATRMTNYKQPETFTIGYEPLPRNLNGKVLKAELRRVSSAD